MTPTELGEDTAATALGKPCSVASQKVLISFAWCSYHQKHSKLNSENAHRTGKWIWMGRMPVDSLDKRLVGIVNPLRGLPKDGFVLTVPEGRGLLHPRIRCMGQSLLNAQCRTR